MHFPFTILAKDCPAGKVYSESRSRCPVTCENMYQTLSASCEQGPVSGCECKQGLVLSGNDCIPPSECTCLQFGHTYKPGDSFQSGCNKWWVVFFRTSHLKLKIIIVWLIISFLYQSVYRETDTYIWC